MKLIKIFFLLLVLSSGMWSCSRKKNTFINRNWHAITAEYNTLYNGNRALELGVEALNQTYRDNFWQLLPIEPMQIKDEVLAPGETVNPNFEIAEQKAVKAIQKHSMLLDGSEKNPQIDEAYLLLGKARYYDQRYIPALEAFNYILHKYPLSNSITEAQIWREKTNIRLEFEELAEENLKEILEQEGLGKQSRARALATLAQSYLHRGLLEPALPPLEEAAALIEEGSLQGRYWFIVGQIYNILGDVDSADAAFQQVIDLHRKTDRTYFIHAQLAQIFNSPMPAADKPVVLEKLLQLSRNRENRPFLDEIYFELAQFHEDIDSLDQAIQFYNMSLKAASGNLPLRSYDYEALGNLYFEAAQYEVAGQYYDSTLQTIDPMSRSYRLIEKKRKNLDDVIFYENQSRSADSILYLTSLSKEEQIQFFEEYTTELKDAAIEAGASEVTSEVASDYFNQSRTGVPGVPVPGSSFYFYNPNTVAYGKQEFYRTWGDRRLMDNWRSVSEAVSGTDLAEEGRLAVIEQDPKYDPMTYTRRIPEDPEVLDSIRQDLVFANYQLGLIYKEKFEANDLAIEKLEYVLENNPQERLILPTKYHLFKLYNELGEKAKAEALKNDIIFQFPNSRYSAILKEEGNLVNDLNDPTSRYAEIYHLYSEEKFEEALEKVETMIRQFPGDEIIPKVELLKAVAEGRLYGPEEYRKSLNYVALNYPRTEEGIRAAELLEYERKMQPIFSADSSSVDFKAVFVLKDSLDKVQDLKSRISQSGITEDRISLDVYKPNINFMVVHGFKSLAELHRVMESIDYETEPGAPLYFGISTENYEVLLINKSLEAYLLWSDQINSSGDGEKG